MIYNTPESPDYLFEQITQSKHSNPPEPRCSLDFVITTDDGSIMDDTQLRLQHFNGHESLSQLFEFNLEIRANDYTSGGKTVGSQQNYGDLLNPAAATTKTMSFDNIIGANATIMLGTPETAKDEAANYPDARPLVFFNGIISNFALADKGVYHATMKPAIFKLGLQNNYRLFSQCTILQVIIQILTENNISFNKADLEKEPSNIVMGLANYRTQDWLQAGESDLDFINRLMHKVNLFYYFVHTKNSHIMTITDQPFYQPIYQRAINKAGHNVETEQIKSLYLSYSQQASLERDDSITQFKYQQNMTTAGITTVLAQKEATWESQNTAQVSPVYLNYAHQKAKLNMEQLHLVQYGATETEISKLTDTAINQLAAAKFDFSGASSCTELKAGHKFQVKETWLDQKPRNQITNNQFSSPLPIRPLLNKRVFVATSVQHQASAAGDYKNQFSAVAAEGLATPFNAKGNQQGNILAIVTDKPASESTTGLINSIALLLKKGGELIHQGSAAKYLKKNVFSFDSKDFQFENSANKYSCRGVYVRFIDQPNTVSGKWVKLAEHMQTIPEIGSYVVVGRSSDDNEIPEVQQSLQAKGSKVIMPEGYTTNTSVGNSYNTNYGDSTRVSFGANITTPLSVATKIVEEKRKTAIYNDVSYGQSSSYNYSVSARNHSVSSLGEGAPLPFDDNLMAANVQYSNSAVYGDVYSKSLTNGNSVHDSTTNGNTTSKSVQTGNITSSNNLTGDTNSSSVNTGDTVSSNTVTGNATHTSLTTGNTSSNSTTIGNTEQTSSQTGNTTSHSTQKGNVTSSNTVTGNTNNTSTNNGNTTNNSTVTGMSTNNSTLSGGSTSSSILTGGSYSFSSVDTSNSLSRIGATTSENFIGASHNLSMTLLNSQESVTGVNNNMSATGVSNNMSATGASNNMTATGASISISTVGTDNSINIIGSGVHYKNQGAIDLETLLLPKTTIIGTIKLLL